MIDIIKKKFARFVQKSQSLTGIDTGYFLKGGSWLLFSNAIGSMLGIGVLIAFSRLMNPEILGEWKFFLSVIGFFSILSIPGTCVALQQSVARGFDRSILDGIRMRLTWSLLSALGILGVSAYFFITAPGTSWLYYLIAALLIPLFYATTNIMFYFAGKKRFDLLAKYKIYTNVILNLGTVLTLLFTKNLFSTIIAYVVLTILPHLYYYAQIRKELKNAKSLKKDPELKKYAFNLTVMDAIQIISTTIDKFILAQYLGFVSLGIYTIVTSVSDTIYTQSKILGILALPKFTQAHPKKAYAIIRKKISFLIAGGAGLAVIGYFLMPLAIPLLFSAKYSAAIPYAQITLLCIITTPLIVIFTTLLESWKAVKSLYYYRLGSGILQTAVFLIFIPLFGIWGAVIPFVSVSVVSVVLLMILTQYAFANAKEKTI
ncbi:hypothetical protein C4573_01585 [Candidatus Woesearchaeota archaeon]|nr:MAG: hypothetical protein C4573_01585 [Candidatus Woesearchaeota archaeon]